MNIKFDYEKIEAYCTELEGILKNMQSIFDETSAKVKRINGNDLWSGDASDGFVSKCNGTLRTCETMSDSLRNMIAYIRNCSNNYQTTEKNTMSEFSSKFNF